MSIRLMRQGGSVASFIVIAFILVVAVVGGIYFVNQRGEQARKDEASKLADQLVEQENKEDIVSNNADSTVSSEVVSGTAPAATAAPTQQESDLPATGAGMDIVRLLAVGLLVASAVSYKTSRTSLRRSL